MKKNNVLFHSNFLHQLLRFTCLVALLVMAMQANAEDLLKGTETNLIDTVTGTGKKYLYVGEFVIACYLWLQSRSAKVFFGVLILSVAINILMKVGGI